MKEPNSHRLPVNEEWLTWTVSFTRWARRFGASDTEAEDIAQDAFVWIAKHGEERYQSKRGAFSVWSYGVVRNLTRSRCRVERRYGDEKDEIADPEGDSDDYEVVRQLDLAEYRQWCFELLSAEYGAEWARQIIENLINDGAGDVSDTNERRKLNLRKERAMLKYTETMRDHAIDTGVYEYIS